MVDWNELPSVLSVWKCSIQEITFFFLRPTILSIVTKHRNKQQKNGILWIKSFDTEIKFVEKPTVFGIIQFVLLLLLLFVCISPNFIGLYFYWWQSIQNKAKKNVVRMGIRMNKAVVVVCTLIYHVIWTTVVPLWPCCSVCLPACLAVCVCSSFFLYRNKNTKY